MLSGSRSLKWDSSSRARFVPLIEQEASAAAETVALPERDGASCVPASPETIRFTLADKKATAPTAWASAVPLANTAGRSTHVERKDEAKGMHSKNTIGKRRPSGWVERRRYFQRFFTRLRSKVLKGEEKMTVAPAGEKV